MCIEILGWLALIRRCQVTIGFPRGVKHATLLALFMWAPFIYRVSPGVIPGFSVLGRVFTPAFTELSGLHLTREPLICATTARRVKTVLTDSMARTPFVLYINISAHTTILVFNRVFGSQQPHTTSPALQLHAVFKRSPPSTRLA
jgi:hypothetical protein